MQGAELTDPVSYSVVWTWVAAALPLLVVAWYAGVTWSTRDAEVDHRPTWYRLWSARRAHLRELDRIEVARSRGDLSARQAHQAVSATVRSFVAEVGPVDARAMNLEQLRTSEVPQVASLVELVYPPAFEPRHPGTGQDEDEGLETVLTDARELVAAWEPSR